jgi:hypothetical protein
MSRQLAHQFAETSTLFLLQFACHINSHHSPYIHEINLIPLAKTRQTDSTSKIQKLANPLEKMMIFTCRDTLPSLSVSFQNQIRKASEFLCIFRPCLNHFTLMFPLYLAGYRERKKGMLNSEY